MNKADLVEIMFKDKTAHFPSKAAAEKAINSMIRGIRFGLRRDKSVQLHGLGAFQVRKRKRRAGRNPKTGESIEIPAARTVSFRPSKLLKEKL